MEFLKTFALALLLAGLPAHAAELVSLNAARTAAGNGASFNADLSADGRFVAFISAATDLTAGGTDSGNVFVRDLLSGTTVLASVNNPPYIGLVSTPRINADGRIVVYQRSTCPGTFLCPVNDVFARDLTTGTTSLVSVTLDGLSGGASLPVISPDGRYVAFQSAAGNLVPNDFNHDVDLFVRDLVLGTTRLISANAAGTGSGNGPSQNPSFSADGRFVAFTSGASDLVANDGNGLGDAFLRDLSTGTTQLVSVNAAGTQGGNGFSKATGISADGRRVVFESLASDLGAADTNGGTDIFVRDLGANATLLVSVNSGGTDSGNSFSGGSSITSNGRFVGFVSLASDLVTGDPNSRQDVFLRDLETGLTRLASGGSQENGEDVELSNRRVVSDDGRFVTFLSSDQTLVTGVTYPCPLFPCHQTFLRDFQTGAIRLLSITPAGNMAGDRDDFILNGSAQISQDGRVVVFQTSATNLASVPDTNDASDLFVVGTPEGVAAAEVPTLGSSGLALLALLVAACGALSLRRL